MWEKSTLKEQSELWFDVLNWAQEQYQFNHNVSSLIFMVVFDHHYLLSASSHLKFFILITNNFQQNLKNFENENEILNMLLQFLEKKKICRKNRTRLHPFP